MHDETTETKRFMNLVRLRECLYTFIQMIMNSKLTQGIVKPMTEISIIIVGLSPVLEAMFAWVMQGMKHVLQQISFWKFQKT